MVAIAQNLQQLRSEIGVEKLAILPISRLDVLQQDEDEDAVPIKLLYGYKRPWAGMPNTSSRHEVWIYMCAPVSASGIAELSFCYYDPKGELHKFDGTNIYKTTSRRAEAFKGLEYTGKIKAVAKYYFLEAMVSRNISDAALPYPIAITSRFRDDLRGACRELSEAKSNSKPPKRKGVAKMVRRVSSSSSSNSSSDSEPIMKRRRTLPMNTYSATVPTPLIPMTRPVAPSRRLLEPTRVTATPPEDNTHVELESVLSDPPPGLLSDDEEKKPSGVRTKPVDSDDLTSHPTSFDNEDIPMTDGNDANNSTRRENTIGALVNVQEEEMDLDRQVIEIQERKRSMQEQMEGLQDRERVLLQSKGTMKDRKKQLLEKLSHEDQLETMFEVGARMEQKRIKRG